MGFLQWLFGPTTEQQSQYERGSTIKKWAKCERKGQTILCPSCNHGVFVRDFTWQEMTCPNCGTKSDKYHWFEVK